MKELAPQEAKVRKLLTAGMSIEEVADVMGTTQNNVHQIIFRIRKKEQSRATRFIDTAEAFETGCVRPVPPTR